LFVDANGNLTNTRAIATAYSATNAATWTNGLSLYNSSTPGTGVSSFINFTGNSNVNSVFGVTQAGSSYGDFVWASFNGSFSERMRLTAGGALGLGTSSPSELLTLSSSGTTGTAVRIENTSTGGYNWGIYSVGSAASLAPVGSLAFRDSTNGATRLVIDSSGNVGVGTTSPGASLHVAGAITSAPTGSGLLAGINSNYGQAKLYGSTGGILDFGASGADANARLLVNNSDSALQFYTNNAGSLAERMRLDSSGRLGVGTSSVRGTSLLDARGDISFGSNATYYGLLSYNAATGHIETTSSDGGFKWIRQSGPATSMTLDSSGRLGIGTTSPQEELHISSASNPYIQVQGTGTTAGSAYYGWNSATGSASIESSGSIRFAVPGLEAARIDSSGRLLVGTSSARSSLGIAAKLQVENTDYDGISLITNNTTASTCPVILMGRSKGSSLGSSTLVANNDRLAAVFFQGADGNGTNSSAASIEAYVDGTPGANDMPGRLVFSTTADGASSPTERMRIGNDGNTYTYTSGTDALVAGTSSAAGTTNTVFAGVYNRTGTTAGGSVGIKIYTNGNIQNINNSYGTLSDAKLKENIVDANSQWNDLKVIRVRNFNFKEGQTHRQIGVLAQELEQVSPGLVYETPDRDAEGNDLGTVTKGVSYSVLYMKAVKALQEAMERIEALEAKVTALEGV
jgi:hypothetical protein